MSIAKFRNILLIVALFFIAMILLAYAYNVDSTWQFEKENAVQADAIVTEIYAKPSDIESGRIYKKAFVHIYYTVNGYEYSHELWQYNKPLAVGSKIKIYYPKGEPYNILREPGYVNTLYTAGAVMVFAAIMLILFEPNIA